MTAEKENLIVNLTFEFSLEIIKFCELLEERRKYVVARQLLRSGTSVGANVWEAQNAESKVDFVHKLKIAGKEANETKYWLMLCERSESYPSSLALITQLQAIDKVLGKIITTSKKKIIQ